MSEQPECICVTVLLEPGDPEWPAGYTGSAFRKTTYKRECPRHVEFMVDFASIVDTEPVECNCVLGDVGSVGRSDACPLHQAYEPRKMSSCTSPLGRVCYDRNCPLHGPDLCQACGNPRDNHKTHPSLCPVCLANQAEANKAVAPPQRCRFVGKREWGIGPAEPWRICQACGQSKAQHELPSCTGALSIAGKHFPCELNMPHEGWGHSNQEAQAIWI